MSTDLVEMFSRLSINDIRQNKQEDEINILSKMMTKLNISEPDELESLIDEMKQLTIAEEEVVVEFKNNHIITFRYTYFNCGDNLLNQIPRWSETY